MLEFPVANSAYILYKTWKKEFQDQDQVGSHMNKWTLG